jgi:hypothetical protein
LCCPIYNKPKSLCKFEDDAYFATTTTGWATKNIFLAFSIIFVLELSKYRMSLPKDLQDETAVLIVDGHPSRYVIDAIIILVLFNVELLILPPHCSHCLQPFDVGIGSPLKTEFKRTIGSAFRKVNKFAEITERKKESLSAEELRLVLVSAFIDALRKATTKSNCMSAFEQAGISPLEPGNPLNSPITTGE